MAVCAFSKVSLKDTFHAYWPFGTELYARLLYVATDKTEVLLAAIDTNSTFRKETVVFRERIAKKPEYPPITSGITNCRFMRHRMPIR